MAISQRNLRKSGFNHYKSIVSKCKSTSTLLRTRLEVLDRSVSVTSSREKVADLVEVVRLSDRIRVTLVQNGEVGRVENRRTLLEGSHRS